jgi:hypothetical protein
VKDDDGIDLAPDDFRRIRRYLAPWLFAGGDEGTTYPPPDDLMQEEPWDSVMVLPTDVALKSSSYAGSAAARLDALQSDWVFSWPAPGQASFRMRLASSQARSSMRWSSTPCMGTTGNPSAAFATPLRQ